MYLNYIEKDKAYQDVIMQSPGDGDDWEDEDEDEGWDEIEDEDYEDELNDKNDLYAAEIDENLLEEEDDDHFPEDDEF